MYVVEYRTPKRFNWNRFPEFHRAQNNKNCYYYKVNTIEEAKQRVWAGKLHGYRSYFYEDKWSRKQVRREWMRQNPPGEDGMYRCVYCGRKLPPNGIEVDHVIPVQAAKESKYTRGKIEGMGYTDVNDMRNLVPACYECNRRKGHSNSWIWHVRAKLGKSDVYWVVINTLKVAFIAAVVIAFVYNVLIK